MTQKVVKGSVIADHLVENAVDDYEALIFDFLNQNVTELPKDDRTEESDGNWKMYFNEIVNLVGNGIR